MNGVHSEQGRGLLWLGIAGVMYGLALGPAIDWAMGRDGSIGLYITCIAVGLVVGMCGLGRMNGWSR